MFVLVVSFLRIPDCLQCCKSVYQHKKTKADLCEEYNFYNIRMHTISLNSPIVFLILFIYGEVIYGYLNGNPCHYDYLWKINLKSTC